MRAHKDLFVVAGVLLAAAAVTLALNILTGDARGAPAKEAGSVTLSTQTYRLDQVDNSQRLTVTCPQGQTPFGGGYTTSPPPGSDGEGAYPNSYERLGQQHGYHVTATLIDPQGGGVTPRDLTLQVLCGHKIGKITPPHRVANLSPGQTKALTAKCPGDRTLIGGGYQRTDGSTNGGVITTESRLTSPRTWRVVAHATGYGGQAVAIGYCVRSKKPRAIQVSGSTAIPTGAAGTATTGACPGGRKLVFGGFSSPPTGEIRFLGGGFNPDGTWSATGFNAGAATTLTAYGYCVRT
jgi:hypothetical protein